MHHPIERAIQFQDQASGRGETPAATMDGAYFAGVYQIGDV